MSALLEIMCWWACAFIMCRVFSGDLKFYIYAGYSKRKAIKLLLTRHDPLAVIPVINVGLAIARVLTTLINDDLFDPPVKMR